MISTPLRHPPQVLKLLADDIRWQIVHALGLSDYRVQELIQKLKRPPNLVSYHLRRLRAAKIVREHRSAADRRDIYYSLDFIRLRNLYLASGAALHPALGQPLPESREQETFSHPVRILFLCTHNSARSQMAEALTRMLSKGRIEAFSAGTEPTKVHPDAIKEMAEFQIDIREARSKLLTEFVGQSFDYVITVCDRAKESCPIFPGDPVRIHWSFPDPAAIENPAARARAFHQTATELMMRINNLFLVIENESRG